MTSKSSELNFPPKFSKLSSWRIEDEKWKSGEIETDSKEFLNFFSDYMQKATKEQNIEKEYQHILEVLEIMMNWDKKPSDTQVRYMSIEDDDKPFQNRFVLPTPEKIVEMQNKEK